MQLAFILSFNSLSYLCLHKKALSYLYLMRKKMTHTFDTEPQQAKTESEQPKSTPSFDVFATGIGMGIVATIIVETGKGAVGMLSKNPLVVLGAGIMTGYFAHKYRKEIILSSNKVAEQGKDFVLRQKKNFSELLQESADH
jgi:hypothetical protein